MRVGIVGGGLAGISLSRFLRAEVEVLEKEDRPGGLCRTFQKDGFAYDVGGHILFSAQAELLERLRGVLGENVLRRRRYNEILFQGRTLKYPFENGIGVLDKQDIYECLIGYLVNPHPEPHNFREWIYHTFGDGFAQKYLVPYNEKIWKTPLDEMDTRWVARVPKPPVEDIVKSALGMETEGNLHQLHFFYPATGGIESLIRGLVDNPATVCTGFQVRRIEKQGDLWAVSDGSVIKHYDRVVLTVPLREAVSLFPDTPDSLVAAASALTINSVRLVNVGVDNPSLLARSAVYIPTPSICTHRVCFMGYFSPHNVPAGRSSLTAEITCRPGHELHAVSDDALAERVVGELHEVGVVNRRDVVSAEVRSFPYGYVVPDARSEARVQALRDYFGGMGIELHGRFAEHEYLNMDEVVARSLALAERFNQGCDEPPSRRSQ
jgi:protoporphyrinogen oxidase